MTRTVLTGIRESGRFVARILVAFCLTLNGVGVYVPISTIADVAPEDPTEESTFEVEVRELSGRCSRVRFVFIDVASRRRCVPPKDASIVQRPSAPRSAARLIGAGINLRC